MFSCDYNGWADVPEEEREAMDVFESTHQLPVTAWSLPPGIEVRLNPPHFHPQSRAA
ncbi:MAG TPA: hypothetical protein VJ808_12595 [Gemmatimonadales bacterium]|nr:hypothetical protein [Gemmatimonadales bacterium]